MGKLWKVGQQCELLYDTGFDPALAHLPMKTRGRVQAVTTVTATKTLRYDILSVLFVGQAEALNIPAELVTAIGPA